MINCKFPPRIRVGSEYGNWLVTIEYSSLIVERKGIDLWLVSSYTLTLGGNLVYHNRRFLACFWYSNQKQSRLRLFPFSKIRKQKWPQLFALVALVAIPDQKHAKNRLILPDVHGRVCRIFSKADFFWGDSIATHARKEKMSKYFLPWWPYNSIVSNFSIQVLFFV